MTVDTAVVLAALVLVLLWPTHQQLTIRALRHAIRQQHKQLHQHRRAIVQLQSAAVRPPTSIGQPMPSVTGTHRAIGGTADPDRTLRLARPPGPHRHRGRAGRGRPGGDGDCCVWVAIETDTVRVRDEHGSEVQFTHPEWAAFLAGAKAGEFDLEADHG